MGTHTGDIDKRSLSVAKARTVLARIIWTVCAVLALVLAIAAFSYALELRDENPLVDFVRSFADAVDLNIFDLDNPIKEFVDENDPQVALTKTALTNYGLGALCYIVAGRLLERIVRP